MKHRSLPVSLTAAAASLVVVAGAAVPAAADPPPEPGSGLAAAAVRDTGRERCFIDTHLPGSAGSAKGSWMGPSQRSRPGGTEATRAR